MYTENNLCEIVRSVAGDLVEETKLIDDFTHPKTVRQQSALHALPGLPLGHIQFRHHLSNPCNDSSGIDILHFTYLKLLHAEGRCMFELAARPQGAVLHHDSMTVSLDICI